MEFIKKEIENATWKLRNTLQFTIDDTINVPDSHLDMERLVLVKGNVVVEETQAMMNRFLVKGSLNYQILYSADKENRAFDSLEGKVPFVEYVNADGTTEGDYIEVHACLNDLTVTMLHSRKISLKALVGVDYQVKNQEKLQVVTEIAGDEEGEALKGNLSMMCMKLQHRDMLQVAEQVEIPANKPNIYQVIWKSLSVTGVQIKPGDGYLLVTGNLSIFLVYTAEEESMPIQYFTMEVPFEKRLEEAAANEDMISGSVLSLSDYHIKVTPDENGEDRLIDVEAEFTAEIKLYGKEEMSLLRDACSKDLELTPRYREFAVQHLLLRNCAKTKVSDSVAMPKQQSVLQICNVEGTVSIDETQRSAKGIVVEGVVGTQITYLNKEENGALSSTTFDIPFTYEIEVPGMTENATYSIVPSLDQITAQLLNENQIELKAEVTLDVLAFTNESAKVVLDMEVSPINMERKKMLPGVVGYVVKKDDTLWGIAKQYYTTVPRIMAINELDTENVTPGDRLVIVKE
jgi:hypothetical protein